MNTNVWVLVDHLQLTITSGLRIRMAAVESKGRKRRKARRRLRRRRRRRRATTTTTTITTKSLVDRLQQHLSFRQYSHIHTVTLELSVPTDLAFHNWLGVKQYSN